MFFRFRNASLALALLCLPASLSAAPAPLSGEEIAAAAKIDELSIPTPGELMTALNKLGKLDWPSKFRPPIATNFPSRPQMALNLGGLIADGYIAVEAQDAQQVKNIGKDIMALAKPLGVQQDIINRGKSLSQFAEQSQWDVLREELEATQNEVKTALTQNKDQDLVTLVSVGGWTRGMEAITAYLAEHYSESGAKVIRQPAIVAFLAQRLDELPDKLRDERTVKHARGKLADIKRAVSFPADVTPTAEDIKKLNGMAADLMQTISSKEKK
jgi:hypothetical protein